ncbi:hypothetical protein Syun_013992 [Stephania yunnanensis]|uniref:Uncharacterized protein n=1 Tax=Stephania yunnanensis TaxID=152371 RepID=A0AAP0P8C0_9MAGN
METTAAARLQRRGGGGGQQWQGFSDAGSGGRSATARWRDEEARRSGEDRGGIATAAEQ